MAQTNNKSYTFETFNAEHKAVIEADNDTNAWKRLEEIISLRENPKPPNKTAWTLRGIKDI